MLFHNVLKKASLKAAVAAVSWFAISGLSAAAVPDAAPNITYTASGTFGTPPLSGADTLKLAGEPFTISIVASASSAPIKHGTHWGLYSPFQMTGQVQSGLLGPNSVAIASSAASILQAVSTSYDSFQAAFPVKVVGISLTVNARIAMPPGTLTKPYLHTFAAITLAPGNATVTYSNGSVSTVLSVQTGTLAATIASGGNPTHASLLSPGAGMPVTLDEVSAVLPRSWREETIRL